MARSLGTLLIASALTAACGSSDEASAEEPPPKEAPKEQELGSGLPADQTVDELSQDDAKKLCDAYAARLDSTIDENAIEEAGCAVTAAFNSPDVAACEAKVDECVANGTGIPFSATPPVACSTDPAARASCPATVEEAAACFVETISVSTLFYTNLNCSKLIEAVQTGGTGSFTMIGSPQKCLELQKKCPAFTGGTPPA